MTTKHIVKNIPIGRANNAVGKGKILENGDIRPLDVKEGDEILFGKYSGTEITIDGEEMLVMREDDITAIITN